MKNDVVHKDLPEAEIRDFLAKEYQRSLFSSGLVGSVTYLEKEIKELQRRLAEAKIYEAVCQLIEKQGWTAWDISDEILYNSDTYFPFVGTEAEYDALIETIKASEEAA